MSEGFNKRCRAFFLFSLRLTMLDSALAVANLSVRLSVRRVDCETRSSLGDEIANVNFLYNDIVHVL